MPNIVTVLIVAIFCSSACSQQTETVVQKVADVDQIRIFKSKRELHLMKGEKSLKVYKVALGGNPLGHKEMEGDGKTPEGAYSIVGHNPHSRFYKSLRISYPNPADRKHAAKMKQSPGGDIMIHGIGASFGFLGPAHRLRDWTLGCIAVTNEEIDEIYASVADGAAIHILP